LKRNLMYLINKLFASILPGQNEREESTQNTTVNQKCCVCKL
jgi:hypothetical protein